MAETRSRVYIVVPLLLLVVIAVVLTEVFPFREIIAQRRAVDIAEAQLSVLEEENARLAIEADALKSDVEIERIARADFGFVRPGDTSYVIVEPAPEIGELLPTPDPETEPLESRSFGGAVWDFLTGRDLVDDG